MAEGVSESRAFVIGVVILTLKWLFGKPVKERSRAPGPPADIKLLLGASHKDRPMSALRGGHVDLPQDAPGVLYQELRHRNRDLFFGILISLAIASILVLLFLPAGLPTDAGGFRERLRTKPLIPGADPFTAIGTVATIVVAIAFYNGTIRLPAPSPEMTLQQRQSFISLARTKRLLSWLSIVAAAVCWMLSISIIVDLPRVELVDWAQLLCLQTLILLSTNFYSTRKEEVQIALMLAAQLRESELQTCIEVLREIPTRPRMYVFQIMAGVIILPIALFIVALVVLSSGWDRAFGAIVGLVLVYVFIAPVIGTFYFVKYLAIARRFYVRRYRLLALGVYALLSLGSIAGGTYLSWTPEYWWEVDDPNDKWFWTVALVVLLLPAALGFRQITRRSLFDHAHKRLEEMTTHKTLVDSSVPLDRRTMERPVSMPSDRSPS